MGFCPYGPRCHFVHNQDEARALEAQRQHQQQLQQQQQQQQNKAIQSSANGNFKQTVGINHSLPLSPPLSMSTGSDRESPTGSLSLSPTSSMTSFPFGDQISPAGSGGNFQNAFSYVNSTPPESPNAPMSPVNTPPPAASSLILSNAAHHAAQQQIYVKPVTIAAAGKQLLQKSCSSPIAIKCSQQQQQQQNVINGSSAKLTKVQSVSSLSAEEARLPVFNRLSSVVDNFSALNSGI